MSISSKPTKFLYFEVVRLRTLFDKRPEIRDGIIERYQEVVKELDSRGAKFFWNPHPIDQFMDLKKAFIRPNKPAWRIFTPEEVFDVSGFELPVLVDIKIDGMRLQIHNDNGVQIYSEDEGLNKTHKFKEPLEDIKKIPEGTILDTEGVLVADGQVLHRTSFIGYVNGKGFDEEKDKQAEFWVFDVPKWGNKDLTDEPLSVRLSYLKKIPECKHLKIFKVGEEAFICKTREEVLSAIKRVAGKKGSEGAMIKLLSSKYVKDVHNKGWIKLKNLKEVDCLVVEIEQPKHLKGPLQGQSVEGVYNYHVAAGPYFDSDGKILLEKVKTKVREYGGKVYAYLGKTFNTEIKVKVGDIIRIWSPEINKYAVKETDLFTYGVYEPKVLEWVHERNIPDSLNVLDRLVGETSGLHPREAKIEKKEYLFVLDKHYGEGIHTHFDLRWRTTKTHKQEINVYHKPESWKDKFTPARFKEFEESEASVEEWMVTEGKHLERHVMGVDTPTYIDVLDSGTLEVKDHQEDRLVVDIKGKVLNGLYEFELTGSMEELTKDNSNAMYLPRHSSMMVWSGIKTQIVKEKHFEGMIEKDLFLCDDHYYYGKIILTKMYEMDRKEVEKQTEKNRITGEDWKDWEGAQIFYGYDFKFEALFEPQVVEVPHGAQTFFVLDEGKNKEALGMDYSPALIGTMRKADGPTLTDYGTLAKPGELLPDKYYKFHPSVKDPRFVLQRHYPTGEKIPIKPGEEVPQMHKGFVVEYDEKHPEAFRNFMADLMDQFGELEADEQVKIEKSSFGFLFSDLITKIRDHLDLRMEISDTRLVGVTIHPPVPGGISSWDAFKSRLAGEEKTQVTPKYEHPHPWLTREGELRFPTRHENQPEQTAHYLEVARMDILDSGAVKFGVQREDLHEFFFYGKVLKGRWVIRKLKIGTEVAHWAWLLMKPLDQRPLDPVLHRDSGHVQIDRVAQPTTEERAHIEEETQSAREERGQAV